MLAERRIETEAGAQREAFVGSPTIRVGGVDVQPPADDTRGPHLSHYRHRDGRISPLPDPEDVRDALETATP